MAKWSDYHPRFVMDNDPIVKQRIDVSRAFFDHTEIESSSVICRRFWLENKGAVKCMPSNFGASSEKLSADNTGLTSYTSLPVRFGSRAVRAVLGCVSSGRQYNRCACRRRSYARAMPIGARLCSIFTSTAPSRSGDIHVCAIKGRTLGSLGETRRRAVGGGL